MLLRFRDALASSSTIPTGEHADRLLMFPPAFNEAMRELDRCLALMLLQGWDVFEGSTLKTLRWHTIAWYVDVDYVQKPVYARKATRNGWARTINGYKLVEARPNGADKPKADQGVHWLSQTYPWPDVHLKAIHEACGTTLAA